MTDEDAEVIERIRRGAVDDFAELVRRHRAHLFGVLHRYERDTRLLEDLAQETFVKAWRALEQFDGRSPFQHWLTRIAVRTALDHLRRQKRVRNEVALSDLGEDALDWIRQPDETATPTANQAREILEIAMRALSPAERLVITLQELEGRSVKEISGLTGSSGVAVRVRALRARTKLKKALEQMERQENE